MTGDDGDRTKFFPAIENKHGGPISMWLDRLADLGDAKYPQQIAYLRENHGFSQAHANALVMYVRNSPTSKRFKTPDDFFATLDPVAATTAHDIFAAITNTYPALEPVIAWNQPMLRLGTQYVFGVSVLTNHLLIAPWGEGVLDEFRPRLTDYKVNKKTIQVPVDWKPDTKLLRAMAAARIAEVSG